MEGEAMRYLTDDADRMLWGCDTFGPNEDYDPMYSDGPGNNPPRCGGHIINEWGESEGCPGCRHCNPPDVESKPYGWGIESFEDPALAEANRAVAHRPVLNGSLYRPLAREGGTGRWRLLRPLRDAIWDRTSRHSRKLAEASEHLWWRLCDECETHQEAKEKYAAWAKHAAQKVYGITTGK